MSSASHNHSKHARGDKGKSSGRRLHKDWRAWLALLLMLAAILMYVLSMDDSIVPR